MLPGRSGFQVLRDIRARKASLPVLILTAKDSLDERVAGLDAGRRRLHDASRLRSPSSRPGCGRCCGAARRAKASCASRISRWTRFAARCAAPGTAIDLKPKEYALLEFLMRNTDRPLTKSLIIEHVWDIHFDSISNVVEVHINSLRNKIDKGFDVPLIHTVRGVGYVLTDAPS